MAIAGRRQPLQALLLPAWLESPPQVSDGDIAAAADLGSLRLADADAAASAELALDFEGDFAVAADSDGSAAPSGGGPSPGTETAQGGDAGGQLAVSQADLAGLADGQGLAVAVPAADSARGTDGGEGLALAETETARGTEASGLTAAVPSAEAGHGAGAGELAVSLADLAAVADGQGLAAAVPAAGTVTAADSPGQASPGSGEACGAQDGSGTLRLAETEAAASAAGSGLAAHLSDGETAAGADDGQVPGGTVPVADADAFHGEDSGISFPPDGDSGGGMEAQGLTARVRDGDYPQGGDVAPPAGGTWLISSADAARAGEQELAAWPRDGDSCRAADGAEHVTVPGAAVSDTELAGSLDGPDPELVAVEAWVALRAPGGGWYRVMPEQPVLAAVAARPARVLARASAARALRVSVSVRVLAGSKRP